jgi:L-Ala-D/L-Glu epimerase / N-acetyl-D-glutamate racemase
VRASLHAADLHYGGGLVLHTATSGSVDHLAELYLRVEHGAIHAVGAVRANIAYLNGLAEQTVTDDVIAAVAAVDWSRPASELLATASAWNRGRSAPARMLVDGALHDMVARERGQPLAVSLGGTIRDVPWFKTNQTLFWSPLDDFIVNAQGYVDRGYRDLKVRIGIGAFEEDLRRIAALRERFGDGINLAADANGTWPAEAASERLKALAPFGLAYVEQPIAAGDWGAVADLARQSPIPLMLDESIASADDIERVRAMGGRVFAHLKLVKLGGIAATMAAARRLSDAGVPFMIGQMNEGAVGTAAALHVACATAPAYAELYGADGLVDDPAHGISYGQGRVAVEGGPGLGVTFDPLKTRLIQEF